MYLSRDILQEISEKIKDDITFTDLEGCWLWVDKSGECEIAAHVKITKNYRKYILKDILKLTKTNLEQLTCANIFCINPFHYQIKKY